MNNENWEFELGNIVIKNDEECELMGWKFEVDVIANQEDDFNPEKVGVMTGYILDDSLENLFIAADAHSSRLCDFMEDVKIITDPSKRINLIKSEEVEWSGKANYLDGGNHRVIGVCGRVAILDDLTLTKPHIFNFDELNRILSSVVEVLDKLFYVDFIMTKDDLYMPSEEELPNQGQLSEEQLIENGEYFSNVVIKKTKNEIIKLGFLKTGMDSFIIKPSMMIVNNG